jgi:WD40 repeat protein
MSPRPISWILLLSACLCLTLASFTTAAAEPLEARKPVPARTDLHGDPLPPGAIARLGTQRRRHPDHITSLAFSPNGKLLAAASWDRSIRLWDTATGKEVRRLQGHENQVNAVAFAPDGRTLASGSVDQTVRLWDVDTGKSLRRFVGHTFNVKAVAFSPDGKTLASAADDQTVRVWDVDTGKELQTLQGVGDFFYRLGFFPDNRTLAYWTAENVRLWEFSTGKLLRKLENHGAVESFLLISPDGRHVASSRFGGAALYGSSMILEGRCRVWELATGKELYRVKSGKQTIVPLAFSSDSKVLLRTHMDGTFGLWEVSMGRKLLNLEGTESVPQSFAFSPDGKRLAAVCGTAIRLWDATTGKQLLPFAGHDARVSTVTFAPDGKILASASEGQTVYLWEPTTGKVLHQRYRGGFGATAFAFTAGAPKSVILGYQGHPHSLEDAITGKQVRPVEGKGGTDTVAVFSPDMKRIVAVGARSFRVWETASGKLLWKTEPGAIVCCAAFSPDSATLATGHIDDVHFGMIRFWDAASGRQTGNIKTGGGFVFSLAYSTDGKTLASAGQTLQLWNVTTGTLIRELSDQYANHVLFTPDGKTLASAHNADNTQQIIHLWDVPTQRQIRTFRGHDGVLSCLAFSPDGRLLATGSSDTTVLIWDLKSP